jgi:hypothetical protein
MSPRDRHLRTTRPGRSRSYDVLRRTAMIGLALCGSAGVARLAQTAANAPYTLRLDDRHQTSIGFIYNPALLADLLAQNAGEQRPPLLVKAVNQQTPVVVMWSEPVPPEVGPPPLPPWKIVILPSGNLFGTDKIEPLWIEQDVTALAPLASNLRRPFIGAIAAFPQDALAKGRRICLYVEYPPDFENKKARMITRCAELQNGP